MAVLRLSQLRLQLRERLELLLQLRLSLQRVPHLLEPTAQYLPVGLQGLALGGKALGRFCQLTV